MALLAGVALPAAAALLAGAAGLARVAGLAAGAAGAWAAAGAGAAGSVAAKSESTTAPARVFISASLGLPVEDLGAWGDLVRMVLVPERVGWSSGWAGDGLVGKPTRLDEIRRGVVADCIFDIADNCGMCR